MAQSVDDIKATYPLPVYNYRVEIGGTAVAFSEASGLDISYETFVFVESPTAGGTSGPRAFRMPAQATTAKLTLKKGVVRKESIGQLFDWINTVKANIVEKKDIYIRLCDEKGDAVVSWKMINAFPYKLDAPAFKADSNEVAIESLELMGDGAVIEAA